MALPAVTLPAVTLIVTQRDRFSLTQPSLESILADYSAYPFQLIYIDGNSPPAVAQYLQEQATRHPFFTLIRQERYLRSNQARNLALAWMHSRKASVSGSTNALPDYTTNALPDYIVFLDNDVVVHPGWLEPLVAAAEANQGAIAAPLILQGQLDDPNPEIHVAGIATKFHFRRRGKRWFEQKQLFCGVKLQNVEPAVFQPAVVDAVEFHTLLIRRDWLDRVSLDDQFDSLASHTDLCFQVTALDGKILMEPRSRVTFLNPNHVPLFEQSDLAFYRFKWNEAYTAQTFAHSIRKWELAADDPSLWSIWRWVIENRQIPARLATAEGSWGRRSLQFCRHRHCPGWLRMAIEDTVLRLNFPEAGISAPVELDPPDLPVESFHPSHS